MQPVSRCQYCMLSIPLGRRYNTGSYEEDLRLECAVWGTYRLTLDTPPHTEQHFVRRHVTPSLRNRLTWDFWLAELMSHGPLPACGSEKSYRNK